MSTAFPLHLHRLESEAIFIMREAATFERPVMLYSVGKDSAVMLHLALKAFYPAPPPFPLLHVDTTWKFQAMYRAARAMAQGSGMELLVYHNPEGVRRGINPFDSWLAAAHRHVEDRGAEAGARPIWLRCGLWRRAARRGKEPGQGAHLLLPHRRSWLGPQEPASRTLVALQHPQGEGRKHPRLSALQLDRARYLAIYLSGGYSDRAALFSAERPTVMRDGTADHGRR